MVTHTINRVTIHEGDCLQSLRAMPGESVHCVVTDPPYGLSFMGKHWDYDVPSVEVWQECLRVLKPGGHLLAFAGTRTQHRMAVRIEDAGFEIRDMIAWVYGSGFPKSLDVSKAIDKGHGQNRDRQLQFTAWMRSTGMTASSVRDILYNAGMITEKSNQASHYFAETIGSQPAIATADMFDKLRPYLPEVPEYIERLVCERTGLEWTAYKQREVIGSDTKARSTSGASALPTMGGETVYQSWNITAPATPEAQRWQGWGTALKPALEPITVARKPFSGTVAETVLQYGTGALNVDGCRVGVDPADPVNSAIYYAKPSVVYGKFASKENGEARSMSPPPSGRWPANLIHDGSEEVTGLFPETGAAKASDRGAGKGETGCYGVYGGNPGVRGHNDAGGSAARFFYCAKASKRDRGETNKHPTVKPTALMRYLCKLITPPGGLVLDPFTGSGSTGRGAVLEGFRFIGMELDAEHVAEAKRRILEVQNGWTDEPEDEPVEDLPGQRLLF